MPEDVEEFFENAGVGLLWVADIDHDFSVYAARDVDNANRFMTGINAILDANADEDKSSGERCCVCMERWYVCVCVGGGGGVQPV